MFKHVETQFWGMVLLYSILVHWVWFLFALTVSHMYGDVSKPWHQLGHFQSVASNLVAFPQFGATIIYHHDVYTVGRHPPVQKLALCYPPSLVIQRPLPDVSHGHHAAM